MAPEAPVCKRTLIGKIAFASFIARTASGQMRAFQ
jgi:hypothetical protein